MNFFGGNWTEAKIEILVEYAFAYLTIMNKYAPKFGWKLLYFDGFAGSGFITKGSEENRKIIIGAAQRILDLEEPRSFDQYYFVEKDSDNAQQLRSLTSGYDKNTYVVNEDCNNKIQSLAKFLNSSDGKNHRVLAYIDPCRMQVKWDSLASLKESNVDVWILVPTGMGVNRLLKNDGKISEAWIKRLEKFLGLTKEDILNHFYKSTQVQTLFGEDEIVMTKEERAIEKSADLYKKRLGELFNYVTRPYILKNSSNSIMFHFFMVSNNKNAVSIADDIIKKYNNQN
ncbi:three-Cys-motif partner protein TcmP [Aggregatimonas sangjinii]|uniref:Three-Cys-motif partner protein TcmP n=1 Tax=Aggregatimonas sangjinii TaxID=2583587 RepID=A0A5B7SSM3_9FLAO|nr:three-Cys-motif partner protein TcmP [Aggregatimonas sangjinii]QCX00008.1 three-Cys-motif partner protein TcmP [Aggregatimonas sangjinii]